MGPVSTYSQAKKSATRCRMTLFKFLLSNMNNIMKYIQFSPLYPLKGRIAANKSLSRLANITPPAGGQGVIIYDNKLLP